MIQPRIWIRFGCRKLKRILLMISMWFEEFDQSKPELQAAEASFLSQIILYIYRTITIIMVYSNIVIYVRSTPRPVTADKCFSFNLPFQNEHKEIAPKISARRCPKKKSTCPPNLWYRIQDRGFTFKIFQAYQLHSNIEKRRAQTTDNTFMCYPEKVWARRLHRSKD